MKTIMITMFTIICGGLLLAGCEQQSHQSKGLDVVSSVNFYGQTAQAVLGNHGHVTSIINNANIDPHDFQPTPKDAEQVSRSKVVISNGMAYDSWFDTLVNSNATKAVSVNVQKLMHRKQTDNPHLWYDQKTMPKLALRLAKIFGQKDPRNRKAYEQNAQKYIASLKPLHQIITQQRKISNYQKVAVSEPVFNYSLAAMGYQVSDEDFSEAIENGTDPSPEAIHNLQSSIVNHRIKFFVLNSQTDDSIVMNIVKLATKHHVPVIKVTETMPNNQKTYRDWMLSQYKELNQIKK